MRICSMNILNGIRVRLMVLFSVGITMSVVASGRSLSNEQERRVQVFVESVEHALKSLDGAKINAIFADTNSETCVRLVKESNIFKEHLLDYEKDPLKYNVDISVHSLTGDLSMVLVNGFIHCSFEDRDTVKEALQLLLKDINGILLIEVFTTPFRELRNQQVRNQRDTTSLNQSESEYANNFVKDFTLLLDKQRKADNASPLLKKLKTDKQNKLLECIGKEKLIASPSFDVIRMTKYDDEFFVEGRILSKSKEKKYAKGAGRIGGQT